MTKAEEASIAYQLVAHGPRVIGGEAMLSDDDFKFWNINYDFKAGYEQAEKDLALTVEDIKTILDISFWNDAPEKILQEYNRLCDTSKVTRR